MKKTISSILVLFLAAFFLFGCANPPMLSPDESKNETLSVITTGVDNEKTEENAINLNDYSEVKNTVRVTDEKQIHEIISVCFNGKNIYPYVLIIEDSKNFRTLQEYDLKKPENSDVLQIHGNLSEITNATEDSYYKDHYIIALMFKSSSGSWKYEKELDMSNNSIWLKTIGTIEYPATDDVGGFIIVFEVSGQYSGESIMVRAESMQ